MHDQIDASVFMEMLAKEKTSDKLARLRRMRCQEYFYKLRLIHSKVSISALGEITHSLFEKVAPGEYGGVFERFAMLKSRLGIETISADKNVLGIAHDILEYDPRITPQDAQRIAEAVGSGAKRLVTLDRALVENMHVQHQFNIRIEYPLGHGLLP